MRSCSSLVQNLLPDYLLLNVEALDRLMLRHPYRAPRPPPPGDACLLKSSEFPGGWGMGPGAHGAQLQFGLKSQRYGNICICITDSLCYKAETKL